MSYKKGDETKAFILKGSKEYFLKNGFHSSTYRKLGEYLNINPNLITYHFSSKKLLAETILADFFEKESNLLAQYLEPDFSPMLKYAAQNRLHYKILSSDQDLLRFYAEAVSSNYLNEVFFHIPMVKDLHMNFFSFYGLEKRYPTSYYSIMETASEIEIVKIYHASMYEDDQFLDFVGSIYPVFLGVPREEIDQAFRDAKELCKQISVENFCHDVFLN